MDLVKNIKSDGDFKALVSYFETKTKEFNIFEVLKYSDYEIRHSNVIGWLLDHTGSHGLGSAFFNRFLNDISYKDEKEYELVQEFTKAEDWLIYRESIHKIDIVAKSQKKKFLVAIENKFGSNESFKQTENYRRLVEKDYADFQKFFIFLTPEGRAARDEYWKTIGYWSVVKIVEELLPMVERQSVNDFLSDYISMVRDRLAIWNNKQSSLAKKVAAKFPELVNTGKKPIFSEGPEDHEERALRYIDYVSRGSSKRIADVIEPMISSAGFLLLRRGHHDVKTWLNFHSKGLKDIIDKYGQDIKSSHVVYAVEINPESVSFGLSVYPGSEIFKKLLWNFFQPNKRSGYQRYMRLEVITSEQLASSTGALDIQELTNFVNKYKEMTMQFEKKFEAWVAGVFSPQHQQH